MSLKQANGQIVHLNYAVRLSSNLRIIVVELLRITNETGLLHLNKAKSVATSIFFSAPACLKVFELELRGENLSRRPSASKLSDLCPRAQDYLRSLPANPPPTLKQWIIVRDCHFAFEDILQMLDNCSEIATCDMPP
ncbi:hypothetical protein BGZ47_010363, partial [Haplosporangium gracile]